MGVMPPPPGMPMPGPAMADPMMGGMPPGPPAGMPGMGGPPQFPTLDPSVMAQILAPLEQDKAMFADAQMQALMMALAPLMANQPNPEAAMAGVEPGPTGPPAIDAPPAEPAMPY